MQDDLSRVARRLWIKPEYLEAIRALSPKYNVHRKPKKSGGFRLIAKPVPALAGLLRRILVKILNPLLKHVSPFVHGGMKGRSYLTHARIHRRATSVFVVDLKDAFTHGTRERVTRALRAAGATPAEAALIVELAVDDELGLPQGAPTSNALFNLLCADLDRVLSVFAQEQGLRFTRYVDEIVFSGLREITFDERAEILYYIRKQEFRANIAKTKFMPMRCGAMRVTGVSIYEERLSLSKDRIDQLRSFLHHACSDPTVTLQMIEGRMSQVRQVYKGQIPKRLAKLYVQSRNQRLAPRWAIR